MHPRLLTGLPVALLVLAACNDGSPSTLPVSGTLRMTGGPSGATQPGVVGEVVFTSGDQRAVTDAAADGTFTTSLKPGTYAVTGTSPLYGDGQGTCRADASVVVTDTAITGLVVACSRK